VIARNDFVCIEASLATQSMDAFVVPVNWHWQAAEVAHVLQDSGAKTIIAHEEYVPMVRAIVQERLGRTVPVVAVRPSSGDAEFAEAAVGADISDYDRWIEGFEPKQSSGSGTSSSMIYTSGTTGKPKAVRRMPASQAEVNQRRELLALVYNAKPGKVAISTGPLYHLFSLAVALSSIGAGASLVVMEHFDAEEFLRLVEEHRVTTAGMVPTMFVRLLRLPKEVLERHDISSLEYVMHTAAPCPPKIKKQMIDLLGPIVWENYGSSETGVITLLSSEEWLARPGTVGRAAMTGEIRIYGEDGRRLGPGEVGDIYLKMHGSPDFTYHGNPEARRIVDREGFVTAGDIGYLDEDGYLFLCDRRSDMLIAGGVNIYPQEIEAALVSHPQIVDAAVFGVPDEDMGELVAAHIQRIPGSTLDEQGVLAHLKDQIAKYKLPRVIRFEESLPRQDNGKIYKRSLREPYWAQRERGI
jgi:long-chain acyl-CoA synthetase